MAKPIILTVDDEPQVLNAIGRDLQQHYRGDYRLVKATSGAEALEAVRQLKHRDAPIALFLADQRMPEMSGVAFLSEASKFYPEARKVLLTAYADTEVAIACINSIGLDHYLMKPWDPPEQNLYPILDDVLSDWLASAPLPYEGIRVAGTLWSASCHSVKDFLARNQIPYQWLDIEKDPVARELVETVRAGPHRLPVIFFPDGTILQDPDNKSLAEKVGLHTQASHRFYDLIIVGAGPAGLAAAVYGASEGHRTALIEKEATGGQAGTSSRIENYLGFPKGVSGADLARRATAQATRLGAEILTAQEVTGVRVEDPYRIVTLSEGGGGGGGGGVIATGVTVREYSVPGVKELSGAGVYYGAAVTEAAHYKGEQVYVVGGANSAGQGAMFFSRYASKVTMVVRGSSLEKGMSHYLVDQIEETENIEVLLRTNVINVEGSDKLETITLKNIDSGQSKTVAAAAMFIFVGAVPHTEMVAGLLERDRAGFILTGPDLLHDGQLPKKWRLKRYPFLLETSVSGIFAAGDVRHGAVRRVASAVGEGATAISVVHQYLKEV
jgi:thioredoxin reductase (NADPH)